MKRNLFFVLTLILMNQIIVLGQQVEVEGQLKVTTINQNNASTDVLVKNADGTISKRSASTIEKQGTAVGDMKYWNGSQWIIIPVGSPGQIMKVSNSGIPSWQHDSKTHIIIQGNITNAQAAAKIASEVGINTQFVWIQNTTNLTSINLDVFQTLVELKIENNTALTSASLNNLSYVANTVYINNNQNLNSLSFSSLSSSNAYFTIYSNPSLTNVSFPALSSNQNFIDITSNAALNTLIFPSLLQSKNLRILQSSNLNSLAFPILVNISGSLIISGLGSLNSLEFPSLTTINTEIYIDENHALQSLELPILNLCNGLISITNNNSLMTVSLPQLISTQNLWLDTNNTLNSLNISGLSTVSSGFSCRNNNTITSLSFNSTLSLNSFHCDNNQLLTNISFNTVTTCDNFFCYENPNLATISFPALTAYTGTSFTAFSNALTINAINGLLATFVALGTTPLANISLQGQNPPAPPTGQGILDKNTLIGLGKTVVTD